MDLSRLAAALIEAAPDAVFVVDQTGTILLVNDQTERLLGFGRNELVGNSIETVVPSASRAAHRDLRKGYVARPSRRPMGRVEVQAERKHGAPVWVSVSLSPVEVDGQHLVLAIARDVSERRAMEEHLRFLSTHDALSGLVNRGFFDEEMARLDRGRVFPVSVVIADLDGLKAVNDREGHGAGDRMIQAAAALLRASFRTEDVIARLGGDEFAILLPGVDAAALDATLERLRTAAGAGGPSISLGGATATAAGQLGEALRTADQRMYADKARRRVGRESEPPPATD